MLFRDKLLIIHLGQFQDNLGTIIGIYYKDILESIEISKSTFYKLLVSLEEKEIIKINYFTEYAYWEITILDNVFVTPEDYKKGYLKLNYSALHTKEFVRMTKAEKVIVFNLLKINDFRKHMIKTTYRRIAEWTGKTIRSVKKFIETLSCVFGITKKDNHCMVDCLSGFSTRQDSEANILNKHIINYRLHRYKCQADEKDIKDAVTVFKQFKITKPRLMIEAIDKTLLTFGELIPKYINKLVQLI